MLVCMQASLRGYHSRDRVEPHRSCPMFQSDERKSLGCAKQYQKYDDLPALASRPPAQSYTALRWPPSPPWQPASPVWGQGFKGCRGLVMSHQGQRCSANCDRSSSQVQPRRETSLSFCCQGSKFNFRIRCTAHPGLNTRDPDVVCVIRRVTRRACITVPRVMCSSCRQV